MKNKILLLALLMGASSPVFADEGMWTFNNFPKSLVKQRYGFDITDGWLDHVRLSSVRFNNGGSGSFVSDRGLVMTNHHVGADCINKLGATGHDYIKEGFYAQRAEEEIKCPDLELNVVVGIEDVTSQVKSVEKPGMDEAAINKAQKEKMATIEKSCADQTHQRCDVVTLYQGGVFNLYRYKKYTDVRLAFAPEFQTAFFGGDPDNFMFPRYDLDVAFFRVYEGGQSVHPEHFLKWSAHGAADGELVFTSGNPGNTERLDTVAQLEFLRDTAYPTLLTDLNRTRNALKQYGAHNAEAARQARTPLFAVENWIKAYTGYWNGLRDKQLMAKKSAAEEALKKEIAASPAKQKSYGGVWSAIAASEKEYATFYKRYLFAEGRSSRHLVSEFNVLNSKLFGIARAIVRLTDEKQKPNDKRLPEYRESGLQSLELSLYSPAPIEDGLEQALLESALVRLKKELGDADPLVKAALAGKTPSVRAAELIAGTKLKDIALRKQLAGNKASVDASKDPMIVLARALDPESRQLRKRYEDEVESVAKRNLGLLARAEYETKGLTQYPDATFTLRLSFGKVAGYEENGKRVPAMTDMAGLYARSKRAGNRAPWDLTKRWVDARSKLKLSTPLDFVSTNDIIGGNSGSPTINRAGEVVGLIFDGNIQSLANNFVYRDAQDRAVSVHSSALTEALRHVYDAGPLADELERSSVLGKHAALSKPAAQ